ncbi:MAG: SDR family NAD(P)-dependent oxidoreductase [Spirochaetales bacterium]|nr:SDR family NAD(P)-dependent oxidoreductase [Spirochaetales bacterium]
MAAEVLVTGATGHLGNVLIEKLIARGQTVRALIYPGEDTTSLRDFEIERVDGDVLDIGSVREAISGVRYVYHLASLISIGGEPEELVYRVNVDGTRNVALSCRESGVKRLVYVSSIHALERPEKGRIIDESLPFDPNNPAGEYDRSKAEASLEVKRLVETGLDAVIVCPTGIIGPSDFKRSELGRMICLWMKKKPHWMLDGYFDFADVRDVAEGLIAACEKGTRGETYIFSGSRIRLANLRTLVQREAGLRSAQLMVPPGLALFATKVAYPFQKLFKTTNGFTPYAIETILSNSHISCAKAQKELGYCSRPIEESVRNTVEWWRAHETLDKYPQWYGKVALITGATGGIGAAVARKLASKGIEVVLLGRRKERLETLHEEIRSAGGKAMHIVTDLAREDVLEEIERAVSSRYHGIDIFVYSAGIGWYGYFSDMSWETADAMMQVNLRGLVRLSLHAIKQMTARGRGRIISIGSIAGEIEAQGVALYSATKAFINTLTRSISRELKGSRVSASVVRPGAVASEFFDVAATMANGRPVPAGKVAISPERVAEKVWRLILRPRPRAYVPGGLGVLRFARLGLGFVLDLLGPIHLRRRVPAGS